MLYIKLQKVTIYLSIWKCNKTHSQRIMYCKNQIITDLFDNDI